MKGKHPKASKLDEASVRRLLEQVRDPEIPVLNVLEMGIVREIRVAQDSVKVVITPTYSGCPAMYAIEQEIRRRLVDAGLPDPEVEISYSPAWTTEWLTAGAKSKLKEYGIAPPTTPPPSLVELVVEPLAADCPRCGSSRTELRSAFGATACKSLHFCLDCQEPFEAFKPL